MSAVGYCCRISAKLLEICDQDKPNLQKHNRGQAELLRRAADMADEQEAINADLLAALKAMLDHTQIPLTHRMDAKALKAWNDARAAIAKAEGGS